MSDFRGFFEVLRVKINPVRLFTLILLSSTFLGFVTGCQKEEQKTNGQPKAGAIDPATTNRLRDAAYMRALQSAATNQVALVGARNIVLANLKRREEAIRKSLPKDAKKEQIQAAFAKDPEWKKLNADRLAKNETLKRVARKNKDLVANRLRAEQEARKNLKTKK